MVAAAARRRRLQEMCAGGLRLSRLVLYPRRLLRPRRSWKLQHVPGRFFRFIVGVRSRAVTQRQRRASSTSNQAIERSAAPRISFRDLLPESMRIFVVPQPLRLPPPPLSYVRVSVRYNNGVKTLQLPLYLESDFVGFTRWLSWPREEGFLIGVADPFPDPEVWFAACDGVSCFVVPRDGNLGLYYELTISHNNMVSFSMYDNLKSWSVVHSPNFFLDEIFWRMHHNTNWDGVGDGDGTEMLQREKDCIQLLSSPNGGNGVQQQAAAMAYTAYHIGKSYVLTEERGVPWPEDVCEMLNTTSLHFSDSSSSSMVEEFIVQYKKHHESQTVYICFEALELASWRP